MYMDETTWKKILSEIRPISVSIASLLGSSKLIEFDGENLKLGVYYKFHKDKLEESKTKKILDEVTQKIFSKNVKIEYLLTEAPAKIELTDTKNENIMKAAQEIFS